MSTATDSDGRLTALASDSAQLREDTLAALHEAGEPLAESLVPRVIALLNDPNDNVRRAAATVLGRCHDPDAVAALCEVAADGATPSFIRQAAMLSLGQIGSERAVNLLGGILDDDKADKGLRHAAINALEKAMEDAAAQRLLPYLAAPGDIGGHVARALGRFAGRITPEVEARVLQELRALASGSDDARIRRSCLQAVASFGNEQLAFLVERLDKEGDLKTCRRCVELVARLDGDEALDALCKVLVKHSLTPVGRTARRALAPIPDWRTKADAVLAAIVSENVDRADVLPREVVRAITNDVEDDRAALTNLLIERSLAAKDRRVAVLAALIIASAGGSVVKAGECIKQYQQAHDTPDKKLKALRIEIGGAPALNPVFQELRAKLDQQFQSPLNELNSMTKDNWQKTISYVRVGFIVRLLMSGLVFFVGLALTIWSVWQFSQGQDAGSLWGAGASFVGGLGSMLAIVYSGPLKDIRLSVQDLASANAAFIGYVHRVLQVSLTFSSVTLRGKLTFAETAEANRLIEQAARTMAELLSQGGTGKRADSAPPAREALAAPADPPVPDAADGEPARERNVDGDT